MNMAPDLAAARRPVQPASCVVAASPVQSVLRQLAFMSCSCAVLQPAVLRLCGNISWQHHSCVDRCCCPGLPLHHLQTTPSIRYPCRVNIHKMESVRLPRTNYGCPHHLRFQPACTINVRTLESIHLPRTDFSLPRLRLPLPTCLRCLPSATKDIGLLFTLPPRRPPSCWGFPPSRSTLVAA